MENKDVTNELEQQAGELIAVVHDICEELETDKIRLDFTDAKKVKIDRTIELGDWKFTIQRVDQKYNTDKFTPDYDTPEDWEDAMREMVQEYNKEMEKMEQLLWKAHTKLMNEFGEENCELITEIREYLVQEG